MKFCYQVATPDVAVSPAVTAFQGPLENSLDFLADLGYDGVEFMTLDPDRLDREGIRRELEKRNLMVSLVCTGEIAGQLGVTYTDPNPEVRRDAIRRTLGIIDFAALLGADINVGRIRGQYRHDQERDETYRFALDALREICDHAGPLGVAVALENVTIMQTNFINTVEDAVRTAQDVGRDNCRIMMDVFHMNIEERDMFATIPAFMPQNIHVHLADNNRRHPGHCGLDFAKIVAAFRDAGYDGNYTTEIFQIPDQETAARKSIEHLRPIFRSVYGARSS